MRLPFRRLQSFHAAILLPFVAAGLAAGSYGQTPSGFTVDPTAREQARVLFNTVYQASEGVPSGWTGNVAQGVAGTTSQAFKDAISLRINYFRAMAGVPATVTFSDAFNAEDQQAALMMSANQALQHDPPTTWLDYTAAGADAAGHSNLALGTTNDGPAAITNYIADTGADNAARRPPPLGALPAGNHSWARATWTAAATARFSAANALWILDEASFAIPAPAPRDGFVAWPPPGLRALHARFAALVVLRTPARTSAPPPCP